MREKGGNIRTAANPNTPRVTGAGEIWHEKIFRQEVIYQTLLGLQRTFEACPDDAN